jgi:hypothetical protein
MNKLIGIVLVLVAILVSLGCASLGIDVLGNQLSLAVSVRWVVGIVGGILIVVG